MTNVKQQFTSTRIKNLVTVGVANLMLGVLIVAVISLVVAGFANGPLLGVAMTLFSIGALGTAYKSYGKIIE